MAGEQARDQIFAGRVDDVQQDDEERDQAQIVAAENEPEPTARRQRPLRRRSEPRLAGIEHQVQDQRHDQEHGRNLDDDLRGEAEAEQTTRDQRTDRPARGHADHDHREQAVARLLLVDVVGIRLKLSDERDVEDTDPDEERHAYKRDVRRNGQREELDVQDEEQRDANEQLDAIDSRGEPAVEGNEADQDDRLTGGGVRPDLRPASEENQRLPH